MIIEQDESKFKGYLGNIQRLKNDILKDYDNYIIKKDKDIVNASDVYEFGYELLNKLSIFLNAEKSLFIYLNRKPRRFENKIENVMAYGYPDNFEYWKNNRDRGKTNSFIPNEIEKLFLKENMLYFPNISMCNLIDYKNEILNNSDNKSDKKQLNKEFDEIYRGYPNKLLFFLIGNSRDLDAIFIAGCKNIEVYQEQEYLIKDVCNFISNLNIDMQYRITVQRRDQLSSVLKNISNIDLGDLLDTILDKIDLMFPRASEIAIFLRYSDRLSPKALVVRKIDQDHINSEFPIGKINLKIGSGETVIDHVAGTKEPYYCDIIQIEKETRKSRRYPLYYPTVEKTQSQYTIPLIYQNELVGVMNIGMEYFDDFLPVDRRFIDLLASHTASALQQTKTILNYRIITHMVKDDISLILNSKKTLENISAKESPASAIKWLLGTLIPSFKTLEYSLYMQRPFKIECFNVIDVLEKIINRKHIRINLEGLGLSTQKIRDYNTNQEVIVEFNNELFVGISSNIISNAIKACKLEKLHAKEGVEYKPEIKISTDEEDYKGGKWVVINFKDNGIKIDEEDLESVFLPGRTEKEEYFDFKSKSSGIGLWVADELLSKSGGKLSFDQNKLFKTFSVHLPKGNKIN